MVLTEHWMNDSRIQSCNIDNYKLVGFFCREESFQHGGVAIYVRENNSSKISSYASANSLMKTIECCAVELTNQNIVILGLYRPPNIDNVSINTFFETFESILHHYSRLTNKSLIVVGDFNFDFLNTNDKNVKYMTDILNT